MNYFKLKAVCFLLVCAFSANLASAQHILSFVLSQNQNPLHINIGKDSTILKGQSYVLGKTPIVIGGTEPYNYNWSPTYGLNSATIANPIAKPDTTTTYYLNISDAKGCSKLDSIKITVNNNPTGVKYDLGVYNIKVIPNPNNGLFTLTSERAFKSNCHIVIYNATGKQVFSQEINSNPYTLNLPINLIGNSSGMYLVKLSTEHFNFITKLIIE